MSRRSKFSGGGMDRSHFGSRLALACASPGTAGAGRGPVAHSLRLELHRRLRTSLTEAGAGRETFCPGAGGMKEEPEENQGEGAPGPTLGPR